MNTKVNIISCEKASDKTIKYIQALSLCCVTTIEVNLSKRVYFQHKIENDIHSVDSDIYSDYKILEYCSGFTGSNIEKVIKALMFDELCHAFNEGKSIAIQFGLKENSTASTHECVISFYTENEQSYALILIRDISVEAKADELNRENLDLREQQFMNERYKMVVEQSGTIVFEWANSANARYISPQLPQLFCGNYNGRDVLKVWREDKVIHPDDDAILSDKLAKGEYPSTRSPIHVRLKCRSGNYAWCKLCFAYYYADDGSVERIIGMLTNEDEAVCSRMLLEYRAQYDTLTGIYNAQTFYSTANKLMRGHPENNYAIMRMDISRFKALNELYGIDEGDRILCRIATTIESALLGFGICGRLYSDVFVMCVPEKSPSFLSEFVQELAKNVGNLLPGSGIHPYFGIYRVADRTTPSSILCDRAGVALLQIKGSLLRNHAYYDDAMHLREIAERRIETEMERALRTGEFIIYLQPKHSLVSSKPIGAEALVRWNRPNEGILTPASFIPIFERNGFIIKLDEFVWEEVFKLLRKWLDKGLSPLPISVNVSRVHIYDPFFVQRIIELKEKYDVPGYLIELELTETTFVDNQDELYQSLIVLQEQGVNFSIDDFGSGYSSLNMLKSAPAGILKLDREFLSAAAGNEKAQTVVKHTISMANQLNMQVVAEGVENESQAQFLVDAGCLAAQGFFYSHPMPVNEFEALMLYDNA